MYAKIYESSTIFDLNTENQKKYVYMVENCFKIIRSSLLIGYVHIHLHRYNIQTFTGIFHRSIQCDFRSAI